MRLSGEGAPRGIFGSAGVRAPMCVGGARKALALFRLPPPEPAPCVDGSRRAPHANRGAGAMANTRTYLGIGAFVAAAVGAIGGGRPHPSGWPFPIRRGGAGPAASEDEMRRARSPMTGNASTAVREMNVPVLRVAKHPPSGGSERPVAPLARGSIWQICQIVSGPALHPSSSGPRSRSVLSFVR